MNHTLTTKTTLLAAALALGLGMSTPCSAMQQDLQALEEQLHIAAAIGDLQTVQTLLATPGSNVNAPDNTGWTPLHQAAIYGHTATVQALLAAGAHVNAVTNHNKTPLDFAALNGQTATVQALLAAGANVNRPNNYCTTPVDYAAAANQTEVAQWLIAYDATLLASAANYEWYLKQRAQVFNPDGTLTPEWRTKMLNNHGINNLSRFLRNREVGRRKRRHK